MNLKTIQVLRAKLDHARGIVTDLEEQLEQAYRDVADQVKFSKSGQTITLEYGANRYKVTRNSRGRFCVKLRDKVVDGDYTHGMKNLRFDIARGEL